MHLADAFIQSDSGYTFVLPVYVSSCNLTTQFFSVTLTNYCYMWLVPPQHCVWAVMMDLMNSALERGFPTVLWWGLCAVASTQWSEEKQERDLWRQALSETGHSWSAERLQPQEEPVISPNVTRHRLNGHMDTETLISWESNADWDNTSNSLVNVWADSVMFLNSTADLMQHLG